MLAPAEASPNLRLPSSFELPSLDDAPVDDEDQSFIAEDKLSNLEQELIKYRRGCLKNRPHL